MQSDDELGVLLAEHPTVSARIVLLLILGVTPIVVGIGILYFSSVGKPVNTRQILGATSTLPPFPSTTSVQTKFATMSASTAKMSLNQATERELDTLPGIGEVRARQIIEGRPYTAVTELREKAGLPSSVIEAITPYVSVP